MQLALAGAAVVAGSACDRGTALNPPLQTPLTVLVSSPTDGGTVAADEALRFRMSTFLRPDTVNRQSISVTAGTLAKDGTPLAGEVFLDPSYDMVERVVTFRLPAGYTWVPSVRTTITLPQAATDDDATPGLRAINNVGLAQPIVISFTATATPLAPPEAAAPYAGYCNQCNGAALVYGASGILNGSCAAGNCHDSGAVTAPGYIAMGLKLTDAAGLRTTALHFPAHETLTAASSVDGPTDPFAFGKGMPVIDPGNPGNSYLMYKVLLEPSAFVPIADPTKVQSVTPEPIGGNLAPDAQLFDDLRERFVIGDPMPETQRKILGYEKSRVLHDWIAAGAIIDDACPDLSACTTGTVDGSFQNVTAIFQHNCAYSGCHSPLTQGGAEHGLDLSGDPSLFVGKPRRDHPEDIIVVAGDPSTSFMDRMINGTWKSPTDCADATDDACDAQMPLGGTPEGAKTLTATDIASIEAWIVAGATIDN